MSASAKQQELDRGNQQPIKQEKSWWGWLWGIMGVKVAGPLDPAAKVLNVPLQSKKERICDIKTGNHHVVLLSSTGNVYVMAADAAGNRFGQLGLHRIDAALEEEQTGFELVQDVKDIKQIACGELHTVAMAADGSVYGFGHNAWGQLGIEDSARLVVDFPERIMKEIGEGNKAVAVSAGGSNTFVVADSCADGDEAADGKDSGRWEVWGVGIGQSGQLGHGLVFFSANFSGITSKQLLLR